MLQRSKTLGERLKKVREESKISLDEAVQGTQIQKKYLEALEQGNYSLLPGPVYIESFLKKYADFLKVSSDYVLSLYHQHEKKTLRKKHESSFSPLPKSVNKGIITPRLIRRIIIGLIIAFCLAYVVFVIAKIFSPPKLIINSPDDYTTVDKNSIEISGSTEPEAILTINGKQIFLDEKGNFFEIVSLKEGVNEIIISAAKEKSKETTLRRSIIFDPSI
jgi:cytoskeletal protein RodZ